MDKAMSVSSTGGIRRTRSSSGGLLVLLSATLAPWSSGCGSDSSASTSNTQIKDENNYAVKSDLKIPIEETQPGADVEVCWDEVTTDFMGHAVVPGTDTGIKGVHWGQITRLTEDQIEEQFAIGTFDSTKYVKKIRTFPVTDANTTCANLSEFHTGESYLVPAQDYVPSVDKYMLLFAGSQVQGEATRSAMFIKPTEGSEITKVKGPNGGPELQFSADFNKPKVDIPIAGPWVVDWSQLTKDCVGVDVVFQNIESLRLAYYPGYDTAKLAASALDYDRIEGATYYKVTIPGGRRSVDLAEVKTDSGQAFTGFSETDGLWVIALECSKCYLPAPIAVAILNPTN
jgi:hypothetical protein